MPTQSHPVLRVARALLKREDEWYADSNKPIIITVAIIIPVVCLGAVFLAAFLVRRRTRRRLAAFPARRDPNLYMPGPIPAPIRRQRPSFTADMAIRPLSKVHAAPSRASPREHPGERLRLSVGSEVMAELRDAAALQPPRSPGGVSSPVRASPVEARDGGDVEKIGDMESSGTSSSEAERFEYEPRRSASTDRGRPSFNVGRAF